MDTLGDVLDGDGGSAPSYETVHIFNVEYTDYNGKLRVHLFGRLQNGEPRHIEVEGHKPSFFVRKSDFTTRIKNHHAVVRAEDGYASIEGDQLVRIYVSLPKQISGNDDLKGLREYFTKTWEADVFYTTRFLIDTGVKTHIRVNRDNGFETEQMRADYRIDVSDLEAIDDPNWRVEPRTITADIEVYSPDGFPEAADAEYPVTSIAAHDNYDDEITVWTLLDDRFHDVSESEVERAIYQNRPDAIELEEHTVTNTVGDVRIFRDESLLLDDFNGYVKARRPDVLAGWNSSGTENGDAFDYPYLLNRCKQLNTYSYDNWSPLGQVWTTRRGREQNLTMGAKGLTFLDGMVTYQKTLFSEPDGGLSLDNISSTELPEDATKLQLSDETPDGVNGADAINWAWKNDLGLFGKYVVRDAQSTVGIDKASGASELYQNLRRLTGAQFGQCHNNIDLLDQYILRFARKYDVVLPTNEQPDRDWYYGGFVRKPKFGRHENAIYPDAKSLYPNAIRTVNISPETMIGTKADLEASEYDESDCRWSYIDTRPDNVKKETDPELEKCYYLKPEHKVGFMNEVVDELMTMKEAYDGTELYDPVKQVVNSCFTPDTEVLTPDGIRGITDIAVGDDVYSLNPETGEMEVKEVVDTIEKPNYGGDIVHIQNQNIDLKVTPDHRMLTKRSRHTNEFEYVDAGDLNKWTHYEMPSEWEMEHGDGIDKIDISNYVDVDYVTEDTVRYGGPRHNEIPRYYDGDNIIKLLGWYITEGSVDIVDADEPRGDRLNISQYRDVHSENHSAIRNLFESMGVYAGGDGKNITVSNSTLVHFCVDLCGNGSYEMQIPWEIIKKCDKEQKRLFFDILMDGDGNDRSNRYTTVSDQLRDDVMRLLWELGEKPKYVYENEHREFSSPVWRIRWGGERNKQSFRCHRDRDVVEGGAENGVYCIQVEDNHMLVAGRNGKFVNIPNCYGVFGDSSTYNKGYRLYDWRIGESITLYGQETIKATADVFNEELKNIKDERGYDGPNPEIVGGDTDAVMSTLPFLDNTKIEDQREAIDIAEEAADRVNDWYSEFAAEKYNVSPSAANKYGYDLNGERVAHYIELEIESYGPTLYIPEPATANAEGKKRYAQLIAWDEGDWEFDPNTDGALDADGLLRGDISYTGIDVVRSDRAAVTKSLMEDVLSHILRAPTQSDARERVYSDVESTVDAIRNGDADYSHFARPRGMSKPPEKYGSPSNTPMPTYRGAKYANQNFEWENMTGGAKPMLLYIDKVRSSEYPHTYTAETKEGGRPVDAVALEHPERLPDGFRIDIDKMVEKVIEDPLAPILSPLNWSVEDALADTEQVGFGDFM